MSATSNAQSFTTPRLLTAIIIVTTTALAPPPARAQTVRLQMRSEALAIMQVCRADYDRLCAGVVPGGGRVLACLESQANQLSPGCAQSLPRAQSLRDNAAAAGLLAK